MTEIWRYVFEAELGIDLTRTPVFFTEPLLNPRSNRMKATEIIFETFRTPATLFGIPSVMAMYASGMITGYSVHIGDGAISFLTFDSHGD